MYGVLIFDGIMFGFRFYRVICKLLRQTIGVACLKHGVAEEYGGEPEILLTKYVYFLNEA